MLTGQTMKNTEKEWALKILNNCFLRKCVFVVQRAGGRDCLKVMFTSQKYLDINEKYCNRFFGAAVDAQRQDSYPLGNQLLISLKQIKRFPEKIFIWIPVGGIVITGQNIWSEGDNGTH